MPNQKGFTIPEFLVIIAVISVTTIFATIGFANYQKNSKLRSEARLMATNLRLAQQLAITKQNFYEFRLFPLSDSYQIYNAESDEVKKEVFLDNEIHINQIDSLTDDKVIFNPTGAVSETGSIYLTNSQNSTSTIEIKASGYVQIID